MTRIVFKTMAAVALTAGLLLAQGPAFGPRGQRARDPQRQPDPQQSLEWRMARLAFRLNLTDNQKGQAKSIFEQALVASHTLRQEALQVREELRAAVKANRADQIATLSTTLGALTGKIRAIQATAYADFYNNVLTATQREQADQMGGRGMGFGFGCRGMNCPMGALP